jgi:hypothetical protein
MPAVRDHTGADVKRLVEQVGVKQGEVRKLVEQLRAKRAELLQQASMLAEAENQLNALLGIRGDGQSVKSWTAPRTQLDPSTAGVERKLDALVQELAALRLLFRREIAADAVPTPSSATAVAPVAFDMPVSRPGAVPYSPTAPVPSAAASAGPPPLSLPSADERLPALATPPTSTPPPPQAFMEKKRDSNNSSQPRK